MKDVMIDIETLGTSSDAVVISVGAVFFDIGTEQVGPGFCQNLDIQNQLNHGRVINAETLKWWMSQSNDAKSVFRENARDPESVLWDFNGWLSMSRTGDILPWGNGCAFDISIMESLYETYGIPVPWKFWNVMDLRTFRRFTAKNAKVPRAEGTHHNALDDAINQANYVIDISRKLK